jgi:acyl dehydratase
MSELYLDDLSPGQIFDLGRTRISEEEIIAFARAYDPQPFHVDPEAACRSIYGGVIASGWQTVCLFMRLFADGLLARAAAMGSPGLDELRWLLPVRPEDELRARVEVVDVIPSRSKPDRGIAKLRCIMTNQDGSDVLVFVANVMFGRRQSPG